MPGMALRTVCSSSLQILTIFKVVAVSYSFGKKKKKELRNKLKEVKCLSVSSALPMQKFLWLSLLELTGSKFLPLTT